MPEVKKELAYVVSIGKAPAVGVFRTLEAAEAFAEPSIKHGRDVLISVTMLDWDRVSK
jgi:hypothetical protein